MRPAMSTAFGVQSLERCDHWNDHWTTMLLQTMVTADGVARELVAATIQAETVALAASRAADGTEPQMALISWLTSYPAVYFGRVGPAGGHRLLQAASLLPSKISTKNKLARLRFASFVESG